MSSSALGLIPTAVGTFHALFGPDGLERLLLPGAEAPAKAGTAAAGEDRVRHLAHELESYLAGSLRLFTTPLAARGTPFQKAVWRLLAKVPYGTVTTYTALARQLRSVPRAVGGANGANPLPILVPCHRVIGSDGKLTGYAGGLPLKRRLLEIEGLRFR